MKSVFRHTGCVVFAVLLVTRFQTIYLMRAAEMLAADGYSFEKLTPEGLNTLPRTLVDRGGLGEQYLTNPFTGDPIRAECSPGNFAIRTLAGATYFCTYDENGIETREAVP